MKRLVELKTYDLGKCRYRGMFLDGVFTRDLAVLVKREAEEILAFFAQTDKALKASMKEVKK